MRTIIFGDVHGCLRELQDLLVACQVKPTDTLVSVGDLMDKGPECAGVVQYLRSLPNPVVLVRGNHEERHERFRKNEARVAKGDLPANPMQRLDELHDAAKGLTAEDVAFLDAAVSHYVGPGYLVVHAGVTPSMREIPARNTGKMDKKWSQVYRVRFVSPTGAMVALGAETDQDVFWADTYDGRFGTVYFGHQPFMLDTPRMFPHAVGLDLGCVYGGRLAAAIIHPDGRAGFCTVPARTKYAVHRDEE